MTDLRTLTEAFTELERRADTASARVQTDLTTTGRRRHHPTLIAASVVAVLAIAGGVALLARNGAPSHPAAGAPASHSAAHTTTTASSAPALGVPQTAAELEARFRTVLDGSATFTVTDTGAAVQMTLPAHMRATVNGPRDVKVPEPLVSSNGAATNGAATNGAAIVGTLTASGATGGFDLQIFQNTPGKASCDDPDRSRCTVSTLADGSSLAVGRESLQTVSGGMTYEADLIRSDGVEILMHVSNAKDPKGESAVLAAHPPLTTDQMTAIVASDRW